MRRVCLVGAGVAVLGAGLLASAQGQGPAPALERRVDQVFSQWDTTMSPGCATSVMNDGELVYRQGYGMANLDHDVPVRTDTVFHVASVSKEFTAAAIALLVLDDALSLDDPIQAHLSWIPGFDHTVTVRHLVHHTSGLRDQWSLLGMSGWRYSRDLITNDDVVYVIRQQRELNFVPGDQYLYSNTGYTLLGLIVEQISGQSLREFTRERIFEPLGMTRTHFRDDFSEIVKDQAYGYRRDEDTGRLHLSVTNFDTVGATSLLTTVEDMARWDRNFIDPVVGGQPFLDLIHRRGQLNSGDEQDYAFGLVHGTYRGVPFVEHSGGDAGYRAHFIRFPNHGYSVATLCNLAQTNPGRLARDIADIYLEESLEPPAITAVTPVTPVGLEEAEAMSIEGTYWVDRIAGVVRIDRDGDTMRASLFGQRAEMLYTGAREFHLPGPAVSMRFEPAAGAVETLRFWPLVRIRVRSCRSGITSRSVPGRPPSNGSNGHRPN